MAMLTPDMRAVIEAAQLCFAATVTPEGRPNFSPKGTIRGDTTPSSRPSAVVLLAVERVAPVLSPAYWRGLDEHEIRAQWRERRAALDREFETYLARLGSVGITEKGG